MSTLKYSISLLAALFLASAVMAQARPPADTAVKKEVKAPDLHPGHQLRVAFDVSKPIINALSKNRKSYELGFDYFLKGESYLVAEGGFGNADVAYDDLSYKSSGSFIRIGIDKGMLQRLFQKDWDAAFVGIRYGLGIIKRSEATYAITDPLFGNTTGTVPAHNFMAHWAEINAGVRVELLKNFMVGWNVRARFMLNTSAFSELAPSYIAGYGKGDASTAFDFNFNLCYVLRWGAQPMPVAPQQ